MSGPRRLYIKSFGCQMNVYDSRRMADTLAPEGFAETARPEDADLFILNTCHIRVTAAEKIFSAPGRVRAASHKLKAPRSPGARASSPSSSDPRAFTDYRRS